MIHTSSEGLQFFWSWPLGLTSIGSRQQQDHYTINHCYQSKCMSVHIYVQYMLLRLRKVLICHYVNFISISSSFTGWTNTPPSTRNQNRNREVLILHSSSANRSCWCEHIMGRVMWFGRLSKLRPHCGLDLVRRSSFAGALTPSWDSEKKEKIDPVK